MASLAVVDKFVREVTFATRVHEQVIVLHQNNVRRASANRLLVEQFVMRMATSWEALINDVVVHQAAKSPKVLISKLEARLIRSVKEKFGNSVANMIHLKVPRSIPLAQVKSLIDPLGENISINDAKALRSRVENFLTARIAKKFYFDADDLTLLNFVVALRNFLAHRSQRAKVALIDCQKSMDPASRNAPFCGPLGNPSNFLLSKVGSQSRAVLIGQRLCEIAKKLA